MTPESLLALERLRSPDHFQWYVVTLLALVVYVGLNVEIAFMFGIAPLALLSLMPADRTAKVLGMSSRLFIPLVFGLFCVAVESVLNAWGALAWAWSYWRWPQVEFIVVAYCLPFVVLAWLHDRWDLRTRIIALGVTVTAAVACHLVLAVWLGWI